MAQIRQELNLALVSVGLSPLRETYPSDEAQAWTAILTSRRPDLGLDSLQESGLLKEVFPEVQAIVGFGGGSQGHKDLWAHTKQVVRQAKNTPEIRWAALFHDVGKPVSFSREKGKVTFHQHEYASAKLFRQAMRRTQILDKPTVGKAHALIRGLALLEGYSSEWTDSAVRRLSRELGEHFEDTLLLARADVTTKHAYKREAYHRSLHELRERALELAAEDALVPPLPTGVGVAIMEAFDLKPSRKVGELKAVLEAAIEAGELEPHQGEGYYIAYLRARRGNFDV